MKYYNITVNGVAYSVSVEETAAGAAPVAAAAPAAPAAPKAAPAPAAAPKAAAGAAGAVAVKAPMPGNILDVKVKAGASVKAGDVLVILEAMKMENEILAPQDGTVASVNVNKGDTVNSGDPASPRAGRTSTRPDTFRCPGASSQPRRWTRRASSSSTGASTSMRRRSLRTRRAAASSLAGWACQTRTTPRHRTGLPGATASPSRAR